MTTPQPPTPSKTPFWKKAWFIPTLTGVIGLVLGAGLGGGGSDATEPEPTVTVTVTAEPEAGPTVTVTAEAEPVAAETESGEEPAAQEPVDGDVTVADVEAALGVGADWEPSWAAAITSLEVRGDTLEVGYQEQLLDTEKVELAQNIHNFTRAQDFAFGIIVVTDTTGIDFNVYCGATICADSMFETD